MGVARRCGVVLVVLGGLLAVSVPLYLVPGHSCDGGWGCIVTTSSPQGVLAGYALARPRWLELYWALALLVWGGVVLWWYRRAGRLGRAVPAVAVAVLLAALAAGLTAADWPGFRTSSAVVESAKLACFNGATPLLVSAVALLVLAAAERSVALLLFAVGYGALGYVVATYDAFYLLYRLGLLGIADLSHDPWGVRQLAGIAVAAGVLLAVGAGTLRVSLVMRRGRA
ncbi:hypothetical protein GCM10009665_75870 [Kitasatospora nipponensis]|uniref:Uncharacterized protein n=1 Tax=Kitasatospora nipponensis TaxID=258049 RepID=A0ABN1T968_9ACTN